MLHTKALRYSTDRSITIGQLKEADPQMCPDLSQVTRYCQTHDIHTMLADQEGFHYKFQCIRPKPYLLYLMGDISVLDRQILAVVGPRKISEYGKKVVGHLLEQIGHYDLVTISGLADGVDMICHTGSLDHHVPTIAILGGGIHHFLQGEKRHIIDRIIAHGGLVISEYKLDAKPTHYTFPQRNRVIAGLAHTILIPEAGIDSGSLITANYALSYHKPVYGVMNSIFQTNSSGLLDYIQQGLIKPIYQIEYMLKQHFISKQDSQSQSHIQTIPNLDHIQQSVYHHIACHPESTIDQILQHHQIDIAECQTALSYLEMYDLIFQHKPGIYSVHR